MCVFSCFNFHQLKYGHVCQIILLLLEPVDLGHIEKFLYPALYFEIEKYNSTIPRSSTYLNKLHKTCKIFMIVSSSSYMQPKLQKNLLNV